MLPIFQGKEYGYSEEAKDKDRHNLKDCAAPFHIIDGVGGNAEVMGEMYEHKKWTVDVDNRTGYGILNLISKTKISYEHWTTAPKHEMID
jgi:hypothetical protein